MYIDVLETRDLFPKGRQHSAVQSMRQGASRDPCANFSSHLGKRTRSLLWPSDSSVKEEGLCILSGCLSLGDSVTNSSDKMQQGSSCPPLCRESPAAILRKVRQPFADQRSGSFPSLCAHCFPPQTRHYTQDGTPLFLTLHWGKVCPCREPGGVIRGNFR